MGCEIEDQNFAFLKTAFCTPTSSLVAKPPEEMPPALAACADKSWTFSQTGIPDREPTHVA